jgi:hypothetical protein
MRHYTIKRTDVPAPLAGEVDGTPWASAEALAIDNWTWDEPGDRQATRARVLYDDEAVYVQFQCADKHIYSRTTELNGPVYRDSCVEFFAMVDPASGPEYFNFESNCCGTFHVGFGSGRHDRRLIEPDLAAAIAVATSEPRPTRDESPDDSHWWLAARLPLDVLSTFTRKTVAPRKGDVWRCNFYRIGGKTGPRHVTWSPIELPKADFHRPEFFGEVTFD